jgi:hypothetical protein
MVTTMRVRRERARAPHRRLPIEEPLPALQRTVLDLQQTAGNAAVATLLRQPQPSAPARPWYEGFFDPFAEMWEEWKVRADVAQERERFEAAKTEHQRRLKEIEERSRPHVLKSKGVGTTTRVDEGTAALVQAALAESRILAPYIRNKFPASTISGKVTIHGSEAEFEHSYVKLTDIKDSPAATQAKAEKVRGFFHRRSGAIHLRPTSTLGHAVHEAMHKLASPAFFNFYGSLWEEGVAQYFADCLLVEQGLPRMKSHLYEDELRCAKRLVAFVGRDLVARAYFIDHKPLLDKLNAEFGDTRTWRKKLCELIP